MKELFSTLRLATCVFTLPIVALLLVSQISAKTQEPISSKTGDEAVASEVKEEIEPRVPGVIQVGKSSNHVLTADGNGGVSGRIAVMGTLVEGAIGAAGLTVTLNRRGEVISQAQTDWEGNFRFEDVVDGAYTFIASSPTAISTFGAYVVTDPENAPAANAMQIDVVAIGSNSGAVRDILNSEVGGVSNASYVIPEVETLPIKRVSNRIARKEDGSVPGRVVPLEWDAELDPPFDISGNEVFLFRGSELITRKSVLPNGEFNFVNVDPGFYDFVCFGPHGASAFSVEIVAHDSVALNQLMNPALALAGMVSFAQEGDLESVLSEPPSGLPPLDIQVDVEPAAPFFPGEGGFYGGGGGGGMGDFGSWIGAGLAAWVLVEAINNSNNQNQPQVVVPPVVLPPPTSPARN